MRKGQDRHDMFNKTHGNVKKEERCNQLPIEVLSRNKITDNKDLLVK